jgi:uncharacterized 2Fe-2S/4Fe-4S cluster protein (DUF4445 family)
MPLNKVKFLPDNLTVEVENGTTLLQAASLAGIALTAGCGGKGTCGACKVIVSDGQPRFRSRGSLTREEISRGICLSCQTLVNGDMTVEIPPGSRLQEHQILTADSIAAQTIVGKPANLWGIPELLSEDRESGSLEESEADIPRYRQSPLATKVRLQLDEPSLTDNAADWTRLQLALRRELLEEGKLINIPLSILQDLAKTLRQASWDVSVTLTVLQDSYTVIQVEKGNDDPVYGLAIDIGTTTVVVMLVNLLTGETIDSQGTYNKQARFGDDVISRIIYAVEDEEKRLEIQLAVIDTINSLISGILTRQNIKSTAIASAVVAGNTTMTQLFLGINPRYIRLEPYIPTMNQVPALAARELYLQILLKAREIGLQNLPEDKKINLQILPEALVHVFPSVASYVGGDIVAGTLLTDMAEREEITLFIDIGTNGEIVLGNREWLVSCASSAGPCFEGGGITFGMRAMPGAIERIDIDSKTLEVSYNVIGNIAPIGICGSGLVDCLAKLRTAGIIDRAGNIQTEKASVSRRFILKDDSKAFVLAWAGQTGRDQDIYITENDIKNLIRAKGAIFAGIRSLLTQVGIDFNMISRIVIAGGFGNYLNIRDSVQIGLLPDLPQKIYQFIGNSSLKGSRLALLSQEAWQEAGELSREITYIELSVGNVFMEEFVSALFLPHTDLSLFPSVTN